MFKIKAKHFAYIYLAMIPSFALLYLWAPAKSFKSDLDTDSFLTCLYYSTVTITTLGYGDISAVTTYTQVLVIIETIGGVILIGLFLNSLSRQQSIRDTETQKKFAVEEKNTLNKNKLLRHHKLTEQYISRYLALIYELTTPLNKRKYDGFNNDFQLEDMKDLYRPSMLMAMNFHEPVIVHFFKAQEELENCFKTLLLAVDLSCWEKLEDVCISFIETCRIYDYKSSIIGIISTQSEGKKMTEEVSAILTSYKGPIEFRPSNLLNQFVALHKMIKEHVEQIELYGQTVNTIVKNG